MISIALEQALPSEFEPFDVQLTVVFVYTVRRSSAMVPKKRSERPIGLGQHVDSAILPDKDRHFLADFAPGCSGYGGAEDFLRVLGETAH